MLRSWTRFRFDLILPFNSLHQRKTIYRTKRGLSVSENLNYSDALESSSPHHWDAVVGKHRIFINALVSNIRSDKNFKEKAKLKNIDSAVWSNFVTSCRRLLVKEPLRLTKSHAALSAMCNLLDSSSEKLHAIESYEERAKSEHAVPCKNFLFELILSYAEEALADNIKLQKTLVSSSDLRFPPEWYPLARLMKRKIIYHGGPTNSGKTHHAIERLCAADPSKGGGLFCGPLRLLALEIYERLNRSGVYTSLLTGQEMREVPGATHWACTVEMVTLGKEFEVAVIDEIQMIADPERGHAWTRALQGLRAKEIHVCGGMEAMTLVQGLAESCGDEFELREYKRLSELRVCDTSLKGDYSNVRAGDCIVAFSKADLFSIRAQVEKLTPYKCAMIYGALPPETRSAQARLFNEGKEVKILVASDAIGMGLNLNIRRIIFHTTLKHGGPHKGAYLVNPSAVKQIGGRAGRHASDYKIGEVTTWQEQDLAYVRAVMNWDIPQVTAAGLVPSLEQVNIFSEHLSQMSNEEEVHAEDHITLPELDKAYELAKERLGPLPGLGSERKHRVRVSQLYDALLHLYPNVDSDMKRHVKSRDDAELGSVQADTEIIVNVNIKHVLEFFKCLFKSLKPRYTLEDDFSDSGDIDFDLKNPFVVRSGDGQSIDKKVSASACEAVVAGFSQLPGDLGAPANSFGAIPLAPSVDTKVRLASLLQRFTELAQIDGRYFLCDMSTVAIVSNWLHSIPLSLPDSAPVNIRNVIAMNTLYTFASLYALKRPVALNVRIARSRPRNVYELTEMCFKFEILELYSWLSIRYPQYFVERDSCMEQRDFVINAIQNSLINSLHQKYSHSENYMNMRKKSSISNGRGSSVSGLPVELADAVTKNLSKIPPEHRIITPHLRSELTGTYVKKPLVGQKVTNSKIVSEHNNVTMGRSKDGAKDKVSHTNTTSAITDRNPALLLANVVECDGKVETGNIRHSPSAPPKATTPTLKRLWVRKSVTAIDIRTDKSVDESSLHS